MEPIPTAIANITNDIKSLFNELIKLLLLYMIGNSSSVSICGKSVTTETKIMGYTFNILRDSLGWTNDSYISFTVSSRKRTRIAGINTVSGDTVIVGKKTKISFTSVSKSDKSIINIISNSSNANKDDSQLLYDVIYEQLHKIGEDIIEQTDPSLSGYESSQMSTAMLRVQLYNLENSLQRLSEVRPGIFESYIDMIRLINSVSSEHIHIIADLVKNIAIVGWDGLSPETQVFYTRYLGEEFIFEFNSNELITILIQSEHSDLVFTSSYLFPLLKLLFSIFGFSKIAPNISEEPSREEYLTNLMMQNRYDNMRGAYIRRGAYNDMPPVQQQNEYYDLPNMIDPNNPNIEPIKGYVYDFIRMFGELYPTLVGLMGGTEFFPPESIEITKNDIPPHYHQLATLPEFLWRFNDYSYCRMMEQIKQNVLARAKTMPTRYKISYVSA